MRPTSASSSIIHVLSEERPTLRHLASIRWGMLVAALALAAIGLATVHSASSAMPVDYLPRQAAWLGVGMVLLLIGLLVDYRILLSLSLPAYLVALAALAVILATGHVAGGARSWIRLGTFGGQPSEFAKLVTALLLARALGDVGPRYLSGRQLALATLIVGVPMGLIVVQPDLGGAAMFVPILAGVLLVGGIRPRTLGIGLLSLVLLGGAVWSFGMKPYQRDRVITFLQPERDPLGTGYQVRQSKIAVGSGQLAGKGYQQGTQSKLRFLPARHTDFIFSVLAEEWGFAGVATTLALFAFFLWNGAQVAMRARDRAGILLVVGLLAPLTFHIVYNCAMVIGLVPITGIPLPFVSYGGSFSLYCLAATGIILGVDFRRYVNR
jgi:rod shape determining protein RodA